MFPLPRRPQRTLRPRSPGPGRPVGSARQLTYAGPSRSKRERRVNIWYARIAGPTCLLGGCLLSAVAGPVAAGEPSEAAQLKAAFVFNFSKYTEWPASAFANADAPLTLCLFSTSSDVGSALAALDGNHSHDRRIQIIQIAHVKDLGRCHLAFLEEDMDLASTQTDGLATRAPVLTIGERSGFARGGGVIGLVPTGKRLSFEVNLVAARQANLKLSSQLLALARIVSQQ